MPPETDEVEVGVDLAVREQGGVFATREPAEMIRQATDAANQLMAVVEKAGLKSRIGGKDYLQVEAWTTLGVMVGCTARTEWTRPVENGWEAAVEVVNASGMVIGRAEAECLRSERNWKDRDDYALRSMAQTRAMGKALRMPLGWIAVLAGYAATPAEEMPAQEPQAAASRPAVPRGDRMRLRVQELAQEADKERGKDAGATWAEVCDAITWKHGDDPEFGATWDALSEGDVEWLGTELGAWIAAADNPSFLDWVAVPF